MAYALRYYSEFDNLNNDRIRVEIHLDGFGGDASEVVLSRPAVSVNYSVDDIFQPMRKSGASISLLVPKPLDDLYTGQLTNPQVRIYRNGSLFWFGYVTPSIYTQPYKDELDILTIECVDSLAVMSNVDFKKDGEISSFYDIISRWLDMADPTHLAGNLYVPKNVECGGNSDILERLFIYQRNFLDEMNEGQKVDEAISDLLRYLGFTLIQWKDAYYIISVSSMPATDYFCYDRSTGDKTQVSIPASISDVMEIGIGKGTGSISLGGLYNKLTVVANNNPLGNIIPEFDDENDIVNQNANPNNYYTETYSYEDNAYTLLSAFFKSKGNWNYTIPTNGSTQISEVTASNRDSITNGVFWQKVYSYDNADGEPSNIDWSLYLTMVGSGTPQLSLATSDTMIVRGGYLVIDLKYRFSTNIAAHSVLRSMYDSSAFGTCTNLTWTDNTDYIGHNWPHDTTFRCKLRVGDYYFDGISWKTTAERQALEQRYLAIYNGLGFDLSGSEHNWYLKTDSTGFSEAISEQEYNAYNGTKSSGTTSYANAKYFTKNGSGDTKIYVSDEYYNEVVFGDSFYLVHKNTTNERIYDTDYSLTNTVSYKMNLNTSLNGMAIPCDESILMYGNIGLEIYACDMLGTNPQPRTDIGSTTLRAIHLSDLALSYTKENSTVNIFSTTTPDPDVKYTNVINNSYVNEIDDITLRVNTCNKAATSYSYAFRQAGNKYDYITGLDFGNGEELPEHRLIDVYTNYHSTPKYIYSNTIRDNGSVTPFSMIHESTLNKDFLLGNMTYDLTDNNIEIEGNQI